MLGNSGYGPLSTFAHPDNGGYDFSGNDFDDLSSFFDYSFLPMQRISMFSGASGKTAAREE
jgi:hypothetical protein